MATDMATGVRELAIGSVPGLVAISLIVLTVQGVAAIATGNLWIFLVHFPLANLGLGIMFAWTARGPRPVMARLTSELTGCAARPPNSHACTPSSSALPCCEPASSCCWPPS